MSQFIDNITLPSTYKSPIGDGGFYFYSARELSQFGNDTARGTSEYRYRTRVYKNFEKADNIIFDGDYYIKGEGLLNPPTISGNPSGERINLEPNNIYIVVYGWYIKTNFSGETYTTTHAMKLNFLVVENQLPLKPLTIKDVLNRLLDLCEPLRQSEKPRFKLNAEQAKMFDKMTAPQFSFTRQTLRECLQEVGKVIHGEPRLRIKQEEYTLFRTETFTNGEAYIGSNGAEPYEENKTYYVYAGGSYLEAEVESRVDESAPANDDYYLVIKNGSYTGTAGVYEKATAKNKYYYEVYYDMYARQDKSGIYHMPYLSKGLEWVINNYTTWVDSNAEHLVNQLDKYGGVIVEPYRGGAKTVRTESQYVRVTDDNMIIATQYPIYSVEGLEYVYEKDGQILSQSIKPYVFEKTQYDTQLSSYNEQYPYSKAYGLYFAQGQKNINGLNFKVPSASSLVFKNNAIVNILKQLLGKNFALPEYPLLQFRITYTPIYDVRLAQSKVNYKDFKYPAALIVNQQSNIIESRYYGENLKGAVARLGNIEKSLIYKFGSLKKVPKVGQLYRDDYYISAVATEILPNYIRCTVGLSKDFNRLSQYIGVSSEKRYYEISEKQAIERNVLYREYIVVGNKEELDSEVNASRITRKMLEAISATFTQTGDYKPLTNVIAKGVSYKGKDLNEISLPVISSAFGNSISFSWRYADNYSAGAYVSERSGTIDGDITGYWQDDARYTDYYGKMYYYSFRVFGEGAQPTAQNFKEIGLALPYKRVNSAVSENVFIDASSDPYIMRKDNREALQINFQIDFVTNSDIIIGSALASYCPAVRGTNNSFMGELIKSETFTDGEAYIGSNGAEPYEEGKTYYVLINGSVRVPAYVESRTDETSPANDDYYLVLENNTDFSGLAEVYEYLPAAARLYVFDTELNKFTDHVEAYENVDLSKMESVPVTVTVQDGYFTVNAGAFPKTESGATQGKSWAIITPQSKLPAQQVEDEQGNITEYQQTVGGDLLIGQNKEVSAGQAFEPIYFTKKRNVYDYSVWKDIR